MKSYKIKIFVIVLSVTISSCCGMNKGVRQDYKNYFVSGILSDSCWGVTKHTDEYTDEVTFKTPMGAPIYAVKYFKDTIARYLFRFEVTGSSSSTGLSGLYIIFNNDVKFIDKDIDITFDRITSASSGSWQYKYYCYLHLDEYTLVDFIRQGVKKYKLGYIEKTLTDTESYQFSRRLQCLLNKTLD